MSEVIAKRYADALFAVARERQTIDQVEEQLILVKNIIHDHKDLKRVLQNPRINKDDKKAILEKIFSKEVNQEVVNVLKILVDNNRESLVADLQEAFTTIANEYRGIVDVTVTTASPLNKNDEQKIAEAFGKLYNKKLRIQSQVDPKVIGGVLVRVGNRLYDGTLLGKLSRFSQEMKAGR